MTVENRFQDIFEELGLREGSIYHGIDTNQWAVYAGYLEDVLRAYAIDKQELEQAEEKYNEIANYLNVSFPEYEFSFYPQGSLAHQTTVRNSSSNRFDLDVICRLDQCAVPPDPLDLLQTVHDELRKDDRYKDGIELKNRCVKLPLPGERFTIDITPGQPTSVPLTEDVQESDPLIVGDQKMGRKPSNPKGFTSWLNEKAALIPPQVLLMREQMQMKAKADAEPVPDQEVALGDVLRRTIQLLKLHRDAYYRKQENQHRKDFKPISILLTTLATRSYVERYNQATLTPIELMLDVIDNLHLYIERDQQSQFQVANPTIVGENFADKWNDPVKGRARATEFFCWHRQVGNDLSELLTSKDPAILRGAAQRAFGNKGAELVSDLIASLGLTDNDFGANQLLNKLNPREPRATGKAPRNTNHA